MYAEEIEVSRDGNYSRVHAWLDLHVAGSVSSSGIVAKVSGGENYIGYHYYGAGDHRLVDGYYYVTHNSDGTGSARVDGSFESYIGNWYLGGNLGLTKIDRYPILNNGSNFTDKTNPVYNIIAYGAFPIRVKLEAGGNTQLIIRDLSTRNSTTYTLELTDSERETLRKLSTDGKTLNVRETVCAMSGNTELSASFKEYVMTITQKHVKIKVNGQWKDAVPYIRVNNQWKEATPYMRVNGQWKEGI